MNGRADSRRRASSESGGRPDGLVWARYGYPQCPSTGYQPNAAPGAATSVVDPVPDKVGAIVSDEKLLGFSVDLMDDMAPGPNARGSPKGENRSAPPPQPKAGKATRAGNPTRANFKSDDSDDALARVAEATRKRLCARQGTPLNQGEDLEAKDAARLMHARRHCSISIADVVCWSRGFLKCTRGVGFIVNQSP